MSDPITDSILLFEKYREDDSLAADALFERYVDRLTALVRKRMSAKLAQRLDAEDVVQSAYRSFFTKAKQGRYELKRGGDLWRLLAAITLNKLGKQIERHLAGKRTIQNEQPIPDGSQAGGVLGPTTEPSAEDEVALQEEVALLMDGLESYQTEMLTMRLAGYRIEEIANEVGRSERTVRRLLDKVKDQMQARLGAFNDSWGD